MKIDELVRQMHPPRYTIAQAAPLVGKDVDTLRRWRREGVFVPQESRTFGALEVALYTDADIAEMRRIAVMLRPGRKPTRAPSGVFERLRNRRRFNA